MSKCACVCVCAGVSRLQGKHANNRDKLNTELCIMPTLVTRGDGGVGRGEIIPAFLSKMHSRAIKSRDFSRMASQFHIDFAVQSDAAFSYKFRVDILEKNSYLNNF